MDEFEAAHPEIYAPTKGNWWKRWHPKYKQLCPIDKCCFGYYQWFKWESVPPGDPLYDKYKDI